MKILRYLMAVVALAFASNLSAQWTPTKKYLTLQHPK